jgi:hypothetical protein
MQSSERYNPFYAKKNVHRGLFAITHGGDVQKEQNEEVGHV